MTPRTGTRAFVLLAALAALTACTNAPAPSASPSAGGDGDELRLVVIGDSIPFNLAADCPGCTGFVDTFAAELESTTGQSVLVLNSSRHDGAKTQDIADQLAVEGKLTKQLEGADVVIASFGFNDQPPYSSGPPSCATVGATDTDAVVLETIATTTTECVDAQTATLAGLAQTILERVRSLAPDATIGVLNSYDAWNGWETLAAEPPDRVATITTTIAYALDSWSDALCAEAEKVDAACVDIYHRINGEDGLTAAGTLLTADYTHPSQAGNDAIAEELIAALPVE